MPRRTFTFIELPAIIASIAILAALFAPSIAAGEAYTFVSIPDFLNIDVGDITGLPSYDGGGNSTSPDIEKTIAAVLDAVQAEEPDFILVAGDLVMGRWDRDVDNREIFGPTGTRSERAAAIDAAADFYYPLWKQLFADRGLTVHAAIGDHELGDNNWPAGSDKAHLVPTYKEQFAEHFTRDGAGEHRYGERPVGTAYEGTAYAFQHDNTLFVTVDMFYQQDPDVKLHGKTGSVRVEVRDGQLAWLNKVLTEANNDPAIEHIFVQGHGPMLTPVREQRNHLTVHKGENSGFWQTLEKHNVDAYLSGEVHEFTASNHGGVEQIVHGMLIGYPATSDINYLVGRVDGEMIDFEVRRMNTTPGGGQIWQTGRNRPQKDIALDPAGFQTVGTLTIDKSDGRTVYSNRTGLFEWFGTAPTPEPNDIPEPEQHIDIGNPGFQEVFTDTTLAAPLKVPDADFTQNFGDTRLKKAGTRLYVPGWRPAHGTPGATAASGVFNNVAAVNDLFKTPDNYVGAVFGDEVLNELDAVLEEGTYVLSVVVGDRYDTDFGGGKLILQTGHTILAPTLTDSATPADGGHLTWTSVYEISTDNPNLGRKLTIGFDGQDGGQTLLDDFELGFIRHKE